MTQPPNQPPHWWQPQQGPGQPTASGAYPGQWQQTQPPQFGGGFQLAQYGGLGAFPDDITTKKKHSKKPLLFGGIGVLILAGAGVAAWLLGAFSGDTLEQKSLQDGVSKVLTESYGEQDVRAVQCPDGQEIKTGNTFDCSAEVGGQPRKVTVRVLNTNPEYEVGAPH
jgi:hypothetical protein